MHLDSLIEELGAFGRYQIMLTIILGFGKVAVVPSMLMMGFAGVEPDWWCTSYDQILNQSSLVNNSFKNCYWNGTCQREFDNALVTVVSEWNLVCDFHWASNTIISVQMVGILIGGVLGGYGADTYGRKKVYYCGILVIALGNVIAAFSVSWIMFTVARALIGIGLGFVFTTFYLYHVESVGKRWRVFVATLPDWPMGMIVQSFLCQWLHHWKWVHLACAALAAVILPSYFLLHESVRWLTVKGYLEEAKSVVAKMATMNKKPVPDTSILELIAEEEKAARDKVKKYTYFDLFKSRDLTKKTLATCFCWCSCSIVYYGIYFGVKNLSGDLYLNILLMALTELPATPLTLILNAILGRRWSCAFTFLLTCSACLGVAVCTRFAPISERGTYINALAMTAKLTIGMGWMIMVALGIEQIPTVIRNLAYAAHNTSARIGGILAGQVLALGGSDNLMPPFIAMGVLVFLTILGCLALDETQGQPLQDTMKSFYVEKTKEESLLELDETQIPDKTKDSPINSLM